MYKKMIQTLFSFYRSLILRIPFNLFSCLISFIVFFVSFDISLTLKASLMFSIYVFYIIIVGYWTLSNSKELFIWLTNGAEM